MNRLITLAAWTAVLATICWQRLLRPGLQQAFPNFDELFPPAAAPVAMPCIETHESHPSCNTPAPAQAPRRRPRRSPATKATARTA